MTETYRDAVFISTDSHVTEPITLYDERRRRRPTGPRATIVDNDGWRTLLIEGLDPAEAHDGPASSPKR